MCFRCDRAGLAGTIRLAAVRCPAGLAFDIDRQTCDWKSKVESCDRLSSKTISIYSQYFNRTIYCRWQLLCSFHKLVFKSFPANAILFTVALIPITYKGIVLLAFIYDE